MIRVLTAAIAAVLVACSAAPGSKGGAGGAGGSGQRTCTTCTDDGDEDCQGCWNHILDCCYAAEERTNADPAEMATRCKDSPSCGACCNECAAESCEELKKNGNCPNL